MKLKQLLSRIRSRVSPPRQRVLFLFTAADGLEQLDRWRRAGVVAGGAAGIGVGEVAAAYAAGALSLEDAIALRDAFAARTDPANTDVVFLVDADATKARRVAMKAPAPLEFAGEVRSGVTAFRSSALDAEVVRAYLRGRGSIVQELVARTTSNRQPATGSVRVTPRAPSLPLYTGAAGGRIDAGLDEGYWRWMITAPFHAGAALAAAYADGFDLVAIVGSAPDWPIEQRPGVRITDSPRGIRSGRAHTGAIDAVSIDLAHPAIARDPFPYYEQLRERGPVQFLSRHGFWLVLGYDEAQAAILQPRVFSNAPYAEVDEVLLSADPPEHTAMRRLVSRYFSAEALDAACGAAERVALSLVKPRLEIVYEYGLPLSEAVAANLLGLRDAGIEAIHDAQDAAVDLTAFIASLDRIAGNTTIYERLLRDAEGALSDAQARSLVRLLWLAATTTTERIIARCVLRLLLHEDVRRRCENDLSLLPVLVEEVLRLHPAEHMLPRVTTEAVELGGAAIPAGAIVQICVSAANRDPRQFPDPATLRLDRHPNRHLTFGFGVHHCVGAALARRVIAMSLRTLLQRAPGFRSAQPLSTLVQWCTMTTNPIERLVIES